MSKRPRVAGNRRDIIEKRDGNEKRDLLTRVLVCRVRISWRVKKEGEKDDEKKWWLKLSKCVCMCFYHGFLYVLHNANALRVIVPLVHSIHLFVSFQMDDIGHIFLLLACFLLVFTRLLHAVHLATFVKSK